MGSLKNLLQIEYDKVGGPKLSENSMRFLDKLWELLLKGDQVSVYDATIEVGFDEEGQEETFYPLCDRLHTLGFLDARTELTRDPERSEIIDGSAKEGVASFEDYSDDERAGLDLDGAEAYSLLTVSLSSRVKELVAAARNEAEPAKAPEPSRSDPAQPEAQSNSPGPSASVPAAEAATASADATQAPEHPALELIRAAHAAPKGMGEGGRYPNGSVHRSHDEGILHVIVGKGKKDKSKKTMLLRDVMLALENGMPSEEEGEISIYNLQKYTYEVPAEMALEAMALRPEIERAIKANEGTLAAELEERYQSLLGQTADPEIDGEDEASDAGEAVNADTPALEEQHEEAPEEASEDEQRVELDSRLADVDGARGNVKPQIGVLGRTRAFQQKLVIVAVGAVVTVIGLALVLRQGSEIKNETKTIARELEAPSNEYRIIKRTEYESMKQEIADLKAKNFSLAREYRAALQVEKANILKRLEEDTKAREGAAYERGKSDAVGLSMTMREKVSLLSVKKAVINGDCEAFGRGNRIDRIFPTNLAVDVVHWIVDPSTMRMAGVVATNEELLKLTPPVVQVRCLVGRADIWPSYGTPVFGKDGQAKPITQDGGAEETNPLLR